MSRLLAIASLVVALLVADAQAESRPRYGGAVRVQTREDWTNSVNPARRLVFETLTTLDDAGNLQPSLATSWEPQADGRRWQITLRRNVRFHDGTPLTPTNVVDALTTGVCDECPWRSIRALGGSVIFEFGEPHPNFAAEIASPSFALVLANSQTIGTGPYKVMESRSGVVTLAANDDHWQGRPYLNSIEVTTGRRERDQMLDFEVGRADIVSVGTGPLRRLQQQRSRVGSTRPIELIALRIRTLKPQVEDRRLRAAIAASVDRASVHKVIFQGEGEVIAALLPNWMTGYGFLFPAARDLPAAQRLVREIGQPAPLTISAESDPALQLIAERLALNLKDAGITVQIVPSADRADLVVRRLVLTNTNASVALEQIAEAFSLDAPEASDSAQKVYEEQREMLETHLLVPLTYVLRSFAVSSRLRNWVPPQSFALMLEDVWVTESPRQ